MRDVLDSLGEELERLQVDQDRGPRRHGPVAKARLEQVRIRERSALTLMAATSSGSVSTPSCT